MAASVNKVILIGNLGRDPEFRNFPNGDRVCTLSIATSESWKDKTTGEKKERTEWHRVSITNQGLVGVVEKYLHKGDKVYIEGSLSTRKWTDKENIERYSTEVCLRPYDGSLKMLETKKSGSDNAAPQQIYDYKPPADKQTGADTVVEHFEDEIPF